MGAVYFTTVQIFTMVYICNMVKFTAPKYYGTFYYGNTMVFFQQGGRTRRPHNLLFIVFYNVSKTQVRMLPPC